MWERLFELEDPGILERWNRSVLLRVQALQVCLARVDDELCAVTFGTDNPNEVLNVFELVEVIHAQATLDRHRNGDLGLHLSHDASH